MKKPYHYRFVPIDKEKILKHVYLDKENIVTCYVVGETESKYVCFKMNGGMTYSIKKNNTALYEDKEELKYVRWARRLNKKPNKEIKKFLSTTKMKEYRTRFIEDFPEKLI